MSQPRQVDARPLLRVLALTLVVALAALAGLAGLERPAAAQTAGSRGALFDSAPDTTLPNVSALNQITNADTNDGYVHFPFSAADLRPLLGGSTFNGAASLPDGRSLNVRTGAAVDGYSGSIVFFDRLIFGLSPSNDPAECNFEALAREIAETPTTKQYVAITYAVGDERSPGPKLGYVRLEPSQDTAGTYLCMRRETQVLEVNNSSPKYYDLQRSPISISQAWINIGFIGSRSDPDRVEEDEAEEAPEPEPAADAEEAEEPESTDADADEEAEADADAEADTEADADAEADASEDADAAGDASEAGDGGAEDDGAATVETTDAATEAVTSADDDRSSDEGSTDDPGGDGMLIPVLLGLIVLLLAGLLLVLARRGRDTESPVAAAVAAPAGDAAPSVGPTNGEDTGPGAEQ